MIHYPKYLIHLTNFIKSPSITYLFYFINFIIPIHFLLMITLLLLLLLLLLLHPSSLPLIPFSDYLMMTIQQHYHNLIIFHQLITIANLILSISHSLGFQNLLITVIINFNFVIFVTRLLTFYIFIRQKTHDLFYQKLYLCFLFYHLIFISFLFLIVLIFVFLILFLTIFVFTFPPIFFFLPCYQIFT